MSAILVGDCLIFNFCMIFMDNEQICNKYINNDVYHKQYCQNQVRQPHCKNKENYKFTERLRPASDFAKDLRTLTTSSRA